MPLTASEVLEREAKVLASLRQIYFRLHTAFLNLLAGLASLLPFFLFSEEVGELLGLVWIFILVLAASFMEGAKPPADC